MSATNKTTHYELPSFLGSDKPAWLVDWNGAMATIDYAIYEAKTTADNAASAAATNAADILTLQSTVSGQGTDLGTLSTALTTLQGTVNTITSLIGNGEPTTTDKTLIGAINEINAYQLKYEIAAEAVGDGVKTHGDLISEIYTTFQTLTDDQKRNSCIIVGNNRLNVTNIAQGIFPNIAINVSTLKLGGSSYNLSAGKYVEMHNGDPSDITDESAVVVSDTFKIYLGILKSK